MVMLLDISGLTAARGAYSLRKLRSAYAGSAIRVRRTSDNGEADIGFSGEDLDTTALLAHTGTGGTDGGFIVRWYDQTGNGHDQVQATAAAQLKIVHDGAVLVNAMGRPQAWAVTGSTCGYTQVSEWDPAYTGTVMSAAAVFSLVGAFNSSRVVSVVSGTANDYDSTDRAVMLSRNGTSDAAFSYRNATRASVAITSDTLYAAGSRYDGGAVFDSRVQLHTGVSDDDDSASYPAFSVTQILFGAISTSSIGIGSDDERYEAVVWTALLTDAQMAAVLLNQKTYWIEAFPTETLVPTGDVGTPTNATPSSNMYANVDEGIASADNTFVSPTDTSLAMTARFSFPSLTAGRTVLAGAGLCTVRLWVDKVAGAGTTTVTATIHEAGSATVLATPINGVTVTNETGELIEGVFNGNVLAATDASDLEVEIVTAPGSP